MEHTFRKVATEWHELKVKSWSPVYARNVLHRLEIDVFRKIEARGAHEIAKRNRAICGQIFSYAIQTGAATRNPIADMRDVLQVVSPSNFPAISSDGSRQ
jgi:integrase